jgi:hypothetical protein
MRFSKDRRPISFVLFWLAASVAASQDLPRGQTIAAVK